MAPRASRAWTVVRLLFAYSTLVSPPPAAHGYCPPGWLSNITSMYCYYIVKDQALTNANATASCARMGANVTFVDSDDENYKLYLAGPASISRDFWISYKQYPGNFWRWPTGSRGTYLAGWDISEPDGDGACAKQTYWNGGKWRDWPCALQLPYSCKKFAECGQPISLAHASRSINAASANGTTFPPGSTVTYTCQDGYQFDSTMVTVKTAICPLGGGSWTVTGGASLIGTDLDLLNDCVIKKCNVPPSFYMATPNCTAGATANCSVELGTVVAYTCATGYWFDPYSLGVSRVMTCSSNQQWQGLAVDCQKTYCIRPITGHSRCDNPLSTVGTVATYICDTGYQFARNRSRVQTFTCTQTTWDPPPDKCTIILCPYMVVSGARAVSAATRLDITSNPNRFSYDTTVQFTCLAGYTYKDTTVVKSTYCTEFGNWTANITDACYPIQCTDAPPNVTNADASPVLAEYYYGMSVTYTCIGDLLYSDGAKSRNSTCGKDGLWLPSRVGVCISEAITIQPTRHHEPVAAPSAEVYGGVAIIILTVLLVSVVVLDLLTVAKHVDRLRKNFSSAKGTKGDAAAES